MWAQQSERCSASPKAIGRIMQAAAKEFSRVGVDAAKMSDIAHQAGVTTQLVYHYYNNKSDLYKAVIDDAAERCLDELLPVSYDDLDPVEAMRTFWYHVFDQHEKWPVLGAIILDENIHRGEHLTARNKNSRLAPVLHERVAQIIKRGQTTKAFKDQVEPRAFFAASVLLVTGCFVQGTTMSMVLPIDVTTPTGKAYWRRYSVDVILQIVSR
jgi:TetR/AcrR family transcriptional regulator